jgi:hypothetical protein
VPLSSFARLTYLSNAASSPSIPAAVNRSGIISPRAVLFRKEIPMCPARLEEPLSDSENSFNVALIIPIIVLAFVVLILSVLFSVVIYKERQGHPVFFKLKTES